MKIKERRIYLPEIVGRGYATFWHYKGRYRAVKGSRASKKSRTMGLWLIYNLMKYPGANALVVRKTYRTLKDSCFTELKWAIHRLAVDNYWYVKESPLEMTYKPTGQKIYFRGLDDPLKVTSIAVDHGVLCWMWLEEAFEVTSEADFDVLDESIRGTAQGLFKQITLTFNPWNEHHWLKRRFFDNPDSETLAMTTNYLCNEWLDEADFKVFEAMKERNPRRYQVAGLGQWGIVEGLVFENWEERRFALEDVRNCDTVAGLDFGYTNDPTAFFIGFLDADNHTLYVWDEIYRKGLSNRAIYEAVKEAGYAKERITADSAEPKSISELRGYGLRVGPAVKGKDSVLHGIQYLQDLKIVIHPRCVNYLTEISNYTWDVDKFGNTINRPVDDFNHLMDATRYAVESHMRGTKVKLFKGGV